MNEKKIVIIGAGVSGLLCGARLSKAGYSVHIIDKGRNIGGRLSTRRKDGAVFHHGACSLPDFYEQKDLPEFGLEIFKRAERTKIIHRVGDLFEPVISVSNLVNFLATDLKIQESWEATSLNLQNKTLEVRQRDKEHKQISYGFLILSIPPSQARNLINNKIDRFDDHLNKVRMRATASALFSFNLNPETIRAIQFSNENIQVEVENNRFQCEQKLLCLTVHTKEPFARKVVSNDKNKIKEILFRELSSMFPVSLPKPTYAAGHRWLYGFTERSLGKPYLFYEKENVGVCGDWCSGSTILNAASSGIELAEQILKEYN